MKKYKYDVALSYASEDVDFVNAVYEILCSENIDVFFAPKFQHNFLGEGMNRLLYEVYKKESLFVAAFVSESYINKEKPMYEAEIAIERREEENRSCILPIYLEKNIKLPGLDKDIAYIEGKSKVFVANTIRKKIHEYKKLHEIKPKVEFADKANAVTAEFSEPVYSTPDGHGILDESCFSVTANDGNPTFKASHLGSKVTITITYSGLSSGDTAHTAVTLYSNKAFNEVGIPCDQKGHNFTYTQP